MKQTAVEFLADKVSEIIGWIPQTVEQEKALLEALEKAKEMEKEQRKQEYLKGMKDANELRITQEIQLFKESFKSE